MNGTYQSTDFDFGTFGEENNDKNESKTKAKEETLGGVKSSNSNFGWSNFG